MESDKREFSDDKSGHWKPDQFFVETKNGVVIDGSITSMLGNVATDKSTSIYGP